MCGTPPASNPETLARWLLASDSGPPDDLEELTMAAVHTYERLRAHLSLFVGLQGFDALWTRTLYLVWRAFPWDEPIVVSAAPAPSHRLDSLVRERTAAEAYTVLLAVFTQFLTLLFTFIGADLGVRLLQQHWPHMPVPSTPAPSEEAQP